MAGKSREQRARRVAYEAAGELRRKLKGYTAEEVAEEFGGMTAKEAIWSEWSCWYAEEMQVLGG